MRFETYTTMFTVFENYDYGINRRDRRGNDWFKRRFVRVILHQIVVLDRNNSVPIRLASDLNKKQMWSRSMGVFVTR